MQHDAVASVGIDDLHRLYVMPETRKFPYVYREAMEVGWDHERGYLHGPIPPRSLLKSHVWWFGQILAAARAQGCELRVDSTTDWRQIPDDLKKEIEAAAAR